MRGTEEEPPVAQGPESPVMVNRGDAGSGGSSEEEFVSVEKAAPPTAANDDADAAADEDEEEFRTAPPKAHSETAHAGSSVETAAPRKSARMSVGFAGNNPGLQTTSFGSADPAPDEGPPEAAAPTTIDVNGGYRARLLAGARSARDKVRETSATDIKFNCAVIILVGSLTQLFASIPYAGNSATVFVDPGGAGCGAGQQRAPSALGNYALSVGIISTIVTLAYMATCILYPARLTAPSRALFHGRVTLNVQNASALFFGLWWTVGAGVGTFSGPHTAPGNGWAGCWVAFVGSLRLFNATFDDVPLAFLTRHTGPNGQASAASKRALLLLMGWSLMLLFASSHVVFGELSTANHAVRGQSIWAVLVAVLGLKDGAMLLMMQSADDMRKYVAAWQLFLWLSAAITLTMSHHAPFEVASNGYLAVWLGTGAAVVLALEEFQKAIVATTPLKATAVYGGAGLVLIVDASEYVGLGDSFTCVNPYTCAQHTCPGGLSSLALAYGVLTLAASLFLCLLFYVHAGHPPSSPVLAACVLRLKTRLASTAAFIVDGPIRVVHGLKLTPLKSVGALLLAFAISVALALTYFFPPYTDISNGFLACWLSVAASAMLLQEPPQVAEVEQPRHLAVITTISGDAAAAELGVADLDDPSRRSMQTISADAPLSSERPSRRLLPTMGGEFRPPLVSALAVASFLVIVAAAERLGGVREGVANQVSDAAAEGEAAWAVVCSGLTLAVLLVRYALVVMKVVPLDDNKEYLVRTSIATLLAAMWTISAILFTFVGPFTDIGNGYVATAAALGCSIALVLDDFAVQSVLLASRPLQRQ